jgi:hypothetical protein
MRAAVPLELVKDEYQEKNDSNMIGPDFPFQEQRHDGKFRGSVPKQVDGREKM